MSGEHVTGRIGTGKTGPAEKVSDDLSGGTLIERTKKKLFESKQEPIKKEEIDVGKISVKKLVEDFEGLGQKSLSEQTVSKGMDLLSEVSGAKTEPEIVPEQDINNNETPVKKLKKLPSVREIESIAEEIEESDLDITKFHSKKPEEVAKELDIVPESKELQIFGNIEKTISDILFNKMDEPKSAKIVDKMDDSGRKIFLDNLEHENASEFLTNMDPNIAARFIDSLKKSEAAKFLSKIESAEKAALILGKLDKDKLDGILSKMKDKRAEEIEKFMRGM